MKETSQKLIKGVPERIYKRRWRVLGALCGSLLLVMLANMGLNLALPDMAVDLNLTNLQLTWVVEIYSLVFASLLFVMATIGDRFGRKRIMQIGTILFSVAAGYAGFFANSGAELIIARAAMGIGAAMVMPSTLSIVTNIFPRDERARAIAIWTGVAGGGMALGSVLSGFLLDVFNWQATFVFSIAFGAVVLAINHFITPGSKDPEKPKIDWLGGVLSTIGLLGLVYGILEAPSHGISAPEVIIALVIGVLSLITFVWWQLRTSSPMLDVRLFKNVPFAVSSVALILVFFAMMGIFFSLSQLFQLVMGYGTLESAIRLLPISMIMMIVSPIVPAIVKKLGIRWTVGGGLVLVSVGFVLFAMLPTIPSYLQVIATLSVIMGGMSMAMMPATNMLMSTVPKNRAGMGSAMNDTTRELGGALGIAVLGSILSAVYERQIVDTIKQLPEQVQTVAEGSLAGALHVAGDLGEQGQAIITGAQTAWMNGLSTAMIIAAAVVAVAAMVALKFLPHTHKENADDSFLDVANEERALEKK